MRRDDKIKELTAAIETKTAAHFSLNKEKQELFSELDKLQKEYKALDRSHKELSEESARLKAELSPLKEAEQKRQQFSRDLDSAWFVPRETPPV